MSPGSKQRRVLHLVTRPDDILSAAIIDQQRRTGTVDVRVVDFTRGEPDYKQVVEDIFAADAVEVW